MHSNLTNHSKNEVFYLIYTESPSSALHSLMISGSTVPSATKSNMQCQKLLCTTLKMLITLPLFGAIYFILFYYPKGRPAKRAQLRQLHWSTSCGDVQHEALCSCLHPAPRWMTRTGLLSNSCFSPPQIYKINTTATRQLRTNGLKAKL